MTDQRRPESFLPGELVGPPHLELVHSDPPPVSPPRNWDDNEPDTSAESPQAGKRPTVPPEPA